MNLNARDQVPQFLRLQVVAKGKRSKFASGQEAIIFVQLITSWGWKASVIWLSREWKIARL
jgi:hypothetical protein